MTNSTDVNGIVRCIAETDALIARCEPEEDELRAFLLDLHSWLTNILDQAADD